MPPETDEFRDIVDGDWAGGHIAGKRPTGEEMTRALQVMMTRQCLYSHTVGAGRTYDLVRAYPTFFERYFGSLGYRLVVSPRDQMVALSVPENEPRYDGTFERLRKDETIVLLALRLIWEEALRAHEAGDAATVEATTDDLVDRIAGVAQAPAPDEPRLLDILRMFARHGALKLGERDKARRVSPLTILPGIGILVPDSYVKELILWAGEPVAPIAEPEPVSDEPDPTPAESEPHV
ncbi:DUF4194 domain-containing protein [Aureimonas sp. ME7]|uniref:DUF4194 domain-containing protein n=1 Tax=Aureimonas sp. ME7 TaxID=2744252 RepID=UPI0015F5C6B8|nr:DUF4194 domain-containing protein [Aureimonas sp. ME7]